MKAVGLPARFLYTAIALPVGWMVGFYPSMRFLPEYASRYPKLDPTMDGSGIFKIAICVGAGLAFSLGLFALTLPWIRHRKIGGRVWRISASCVVVVAASVLFADQGFKLVYDLVFAAWLTYLMAFTFIRYGIVDEAKRRMTSRY